MLTQLLWTLLAPLIVGMALRQGIPPLKAFANKNKKPLSLTQNSCILFVVWLMASKAQNQIVLTSSHDLSVCAFLAAFVHLVYRLMGMLAATSSGLVPREWVTIVLMCSQKSLP